MDLCQHELFSNNRSTLKEISKDNHNQRKIKYMTTSKLEAFDFDEVKNAYSKMLGLPSTTPNSVDSLVMISGQLTFVEFKNGKMKYAKRSIQYKVRDSLLVLCDIIKKDISFTRENINFILVYNEKKNLNSKHSPLSPSRAAIGKYFSHKGGQEMIRFGLEKFEKLYFKQVHTYTETQFNEYLKEST